MTQVCSIQSSSLGFQPQEKQHGLSNEQGSGAVANGYTSGRARLQSTLAESVRTVIYTCDSDTYVTLRQSYLG